mgnify:CR=1 FL=1|tara:strand:- start:157 stop:483 length:327 start_codon:yes stop_codon:yes gene_type:complete
MNENLSKDQNSRKSLKSFFIKLISISVAIVVVINLVFNLLFAERLEKIDNLLKLERKNDRQELAEIIRNEVRESLNKENLIYEEDKILLYKLYLKLKKEFKNIDKSKL